MTDSRKNYPWRTCIKRMNKVSQFYLLSAFIFITLLFSLASNSAYVSRSSDSFDSLKSNYIIEANKVINAAIYSGSDKLLVTSVFTREFMDYAKTRNVDMKVLFILSDNGYLKIVNYLNTNINLYYKGILLSRCMNTTCTVVDKGNYTQLPWKDELTVSFDGKDYSFHFSSKDSVEFKALFKGEIRR